MERAVRRGWDCQTCGWQRGRKTTLCLNDLHFFIAEIPVMIFVMILNPFTAGTLLVCSWASKMWTWFLSPCQYLHSLFWSRRVWSRLSSAGERNTERFSLPFRLRAFPRLASSGQHKPVFVSRKPSQKLTNTTETPSRYLAALQGGGWLQWKVEISLLCLRL